MNTNTRVTSLAFAIATLVATASHADPVALDLSALDSITAGSETHDGIGPAPNGGAIVGNGSTANLVSSGDVALEGEAQSNARALNLVNSSESTVANGVNVFDGRIEQGASFDGTNFDITQSNDVTQDQRRLASLPSYERGANTDSSYADAGSTTDSLTRSVFDQVVDLQRITDSNTVSTDGGYTNSGSPTLRVEGASGSIFGGAIADADVDVIEFNMPSASNSFGGAFNGSVEYTIGQPEPEFVFDDGTVTLEIALPDFEFDVDAAGCIAVNGSCTINSENTETVEDLSDHSTLYTLDETSGSTAEWDLSGQNTVHAAFELDNAQAEYIVVDESNIDVSTSYLVSLTGSAQSGLRALNAVNAAGSAVANGVNVALQRTGDLQVDGGPLLTLSQRNVIIHSR